MSGKANKNLHACAQNRECVGICLIVGMIAKWELKRLHLSAPNKVLCAREDVIFKVLTGDRSNGKLLICCLSITTILDGGKKLKLQTEYVATGL